MLVVLVVATFTAAFSSGCQLAQPARAQILITIQADGSENSLRVPAGSTAIDALRAAGVEVGTLDRSEPPVYAALQDGDRVHLIRVQERFRTEIRSIPFDRQVLRNESLPEGEERLVQSGVNGQEELTFRSVVEDGVQVSEAVIKTTLILEPVPEIVMLGARSSLTPIPIPGRLVYLSAGNAWLMETSTATRRLLVSTGDLDGHILRLSSDGKFVLFTRKSQLPADQEINTLWFAPTDGGPQEPRPLGAENVIHFADWIPGSSTVIEFSTVEPRANAPGWQANNDLQRQAIDSDPVRVLDSQSGGVYGWWGTTFVFSPSGRIAYARPDGVGIVIQDGGYLAPVLKVTPLQTHADWAWTPGVAWGPDSQIMFVVDHVPASSAVAPEESPRFDLKAVSLGANTIVTLAENVGMFALPSVSPTVTGDQKGAYRVAFLQAIFPEQSDTSRYRLQVIDRDGSDRAELFPPADQPGLEPQRLVWAPSPIAGEAGPQICAVYQGNLWLIDSVSGAARQITAEGLVSGVDWK